MEKKKEERDKKYDRINEKRKKKNEIENQKRAAKGKKPKPLKLKDKSEPTWRESWLESGEPPAILDSTLIKGSKEQIRRYSKSPRNQCSVPCLLQQLRTW